jgi:NAD-dependent dihydropyrimidine dehydrogenase PreA subunit
MNLIQITDEPVNLEFVSNEMNTLKYYPQRCINCGMCINVCPHGVFAPYSAKVKVVNYPECIECGACKMNCPVTAIEVDSGVGCAAAMIRAALTGRKEPVCGPDCCGA